jgi:hypothetical protein
MMLVRRGLPMPFVCVVSRLGGGPAAVLHNWAGSAAFDHDGASTLDHDRPTSLNDDRRRLDDHRARVCHDYGGRVAFHDHRTAPLDDHRAGRGLDKHGSRLWLNDDDPLASFVATGGNGQGPGHDHQNEQTASHRNTSSRTEVYRQNALSEWRECQTGPLRLRSGL